MRRAALLLAAAALLAGGRAGWAATPRRKSLDCASPQMIRDFKDAVLSTLEPEVEAGERWARCVCGASAAEAGVNKVRPRSEKSSAAFPRFDERDPEASFKRAAQWFRRRLPVNRLQADRLAACAYAGKSRYRIGLSPPPPPPPDEP